MDVKCTGEHHTQVPTQINIPRYSYIDYSHKFVGSALVRFERSTLPIHKGKKTVVLRIVKIITPVKCVIPHYDGHLCFPKEGELYWRKTNVWGVNIDIPLALAKHETRDLLLVVRGLQLLWDA
jgi:hypothetical protein